MIAVGLEHPTASGCKPDYPGASALKTAPQLAGDAPKWVSMLAEVISIGTELLLGQIVDTDAPRIATVLAECGIGCRYRCTVGDNYERLVVVLKQALERADVVIAIGGLGPTADDLTREAIAEALGDKLVTDALVLEQLKAFFSARGYPWTESNARQAQRPTCGVMIPNPFGTAPGLKCTKDGKVVLAMPGPPGEFLPMLENQVRPALEELGEGRVILSRVLRVIGLGESRAEAMVGDLMNSENPTLAPYAQTGEVHFRITAAAHSRAEARELLDPFAAKIRVALKSAIYGEDETTLEQAVVQLLVERGETIATAESMTGGGLGRRLTAVSGASQAYLGGVVTYNASMKMQLLGISTSLIEEHSVVSSEVACEMAQAIRARTGATYGVAITGNAGPTADTGNRPVGLVYIAIAGPNETKCEESNYRGIREDIRHRAEHFTFALLRNQLLK